MDDGDSRAWAADQAVLQRQPSSALNSPGAAPTYSLQMASYLGALFKISNFL